MYAFRGFLTALVFIRNIKYCCCVVLKFDTICIDFEGLINQLFLTKLLDKREEKKNYFLIDPTFL